jgi:hypothetical protein
VLGGGVAGILAPTGAGAASRTAVIAGAMLMSLLATAALILPALTLLAAAGLHHHRATTGFVLAVLDPDGTNVESAFSGGRVLHKYA